MIYFYSGTPGSGKSLHAARDTLVKVRLKKENVIFFNCKVDYDYIVTVQWKKKLNKLLKFFKLPLLREKVKNHGKIYQIKYDHCTPEFFYKYAKKFHERGKEGQTLVIMDEAQVKFSPDEVKYQKQYNSRYRQEWLEFFTMHRHLGYNFIIISQYDMYIESQIRKIFEYDVKHKKANNYKIGNFFKLFGLHLFVASTYWYSNNVHVDAEYFVYKKKYKLIYDSYKRYDDLDKIIDRIEKRKAKEQWYKNTSA